MDSKELILTIIIALISNGGVTAIVVGIFDIVKKNIDKKSGNSKKLSDLEDSIKKLNGKLDEHIAQSYRNKILDFQNSCMRGERHTYEQFSEVIEATEKYEAYCETNNVKNQKCKLAIEYIEAIYKQCQSQSDFAPMSAQMINEDELKRIINGLNSIGTT